MSDNNNEWMSKALELEAQRDYLSKEIEMLSRSNFDKVKEFYAKFGKKPLPSEPTLPTADENVLQMRNMCEEFQEVLKEMGYQVEFQMVAISGKTADELSLVNLAKELADLLYVVYGTAAKLGINIDDVFDRVHESNMTKVDINGNPVYRDDGKVMKTDQYVEPDLEPVLKKIKSKA